MNKITDLLPSVLALMVVMGFMIFIGMLSYHEVPSGSHDVLMQMSGVLATAFGTIIGYQWGSSAGSAKKTDADIQAKLKAVNGKDAAQ